MSFLVSSFFFGAGCLHRVVVSAHTHAHEVTSEATATTTLHWHTGRDRWRRIWQRANDSCAVFLLLPLVTPSKLALTFRLWAHPLLKITSARRCAHSVRVTKCCHSTVERTGSCMVSFALFKCLRYPRLHSIKLTWVFDCIRFC